MTDLTVGMVLAEKPPAWLTVMHRQLKHLFISCEVFQKKRLSTMFELKQNNLKLEKERE